MTTSQKILIVLTCSALVFATFLSQKYQKEKKYMIDKYRYITVAKVSEIKPEKSFTAAEFYYYYDGIKYESWESIHKSGSKYLNRYYRVDLSSVEPKYSKIHLDQEVTDSTEIANAGFILGEPKVPLIIPPHDMEVIQQR
ncbi:hypothetical protein [Flavobacterium sp. FlaQc-48]|uniref:hypothetical protein n=1 Tax=Flavobacterium sp. FlaQc-48 TaxID=3374181 RepID=UPI0037574847